MPNLSQSDLDHLSALAEKATPGPWVEDHGDVMEANYPDHIQGYADIPVAECSFVRPENAIFIAAAREAVPALISDRRELSAQLAQAQAERDAARFALCRVYQTMGLPDDKHIADRDWDLIEALIESGIYDAALKEGKE